MTDPTEDGERSEVPERDDGEEEVTNQIRGSGLLLLGRVISLGLNLLTQVLAVRHLSVSGFGAFSYGLAAASLCQTIVTPHNDVFARFFAVADDRRDPARMVGTLLFGVVTSVGVGASLLIGSWLLRDRLAMSLSEPGAAEIVLVLIALAPIQALDNIFESLCAVVGRTGAIFVRKYLLAPTARLGVVFLLVVADGDARFLAAGYVAAAAFGLAVYGYVVTALLRERDALKTLRRRAWVVPVRAILVFSLPFLAADLVHDAMTFLTVAVLGHTHGTDEVAAVQSVLPATRLNEIAAWTFGTLYIGLASRLILRDQLDRLRETYWHTTTWLAVLTFPVFALTVPFAPTTTATLFGSRYAGSATYLAVLSSAYYVSALLGLNAATLQVLGRVRLLLGLNAVVGLSSAVASLVLIPRLGAIGAVAVSASTLIGLNVLNQVALARQLQMPILHVEHLRTCAVLASLTCMLFLARWGLEHLWTPPPAAEVAQAVLLTAVASGVALAAARRNLRLTDMFPELRRIPRIGRLL